MVSVIKKREGIKWGEERERSKLLNGMLATVCAFATGCAFNRNLFPCVLTLASPPTGSDQSTKTEEAHFN